MLSDDGAPVEGVMIEIWQTAANGLYDTQDPDQPYMNFRCRMITGADGRYAFRTVKPKPYSVPVDGPVGGLDEEGNLLCRVADEISNDVRLSDEALSDIIARYGERQATELILCCAYFNMLSRFLESTRVPVEDEAVLEKTT